MLISVPIDTAAVAEAAGVDVDQAEHFLSGRHGQLEARLAEAVAAWLKDADLSEPATPDPTAERSGPPEQTGARRRGF